jgi:hypothetical protein
MIVRIVHRSLAQNEQVEPFVFGEVVFSGPMIPSGLIENPHETARQSVDERPFYPHTCFERATNCSRSVAVAASESGSPTRLA